MNLKPIINEMQIYWLEGQSGGQLLIGGIDAHYNIDKTPLCIIESVEDVTRRKCITPIWYWEIQTEEQDINCWS